MRDITPLVAPRSIAVIGASANPTKSGGVLFNNLVKGDFQGPLYPINRTATQIMGKTAYPTLAELPEKVDLVYIVLPQQHVEDAVKQCVAAGARAACIITAGFSEASQEGRGAEQRLCEIARASGLLLAGPNTIGMVNAEVGMMGSFVNFPRWESGGVSFFTQTGIFTGAVMLHVMSGATQRLPVGKSIDVGNKVDVDELDFLHFVADDAATKVIGLYIESIRNPRAFFDKAREVRKRSRSSCSSRVAARTERRRPPRIRGRWRPITTSSTARCGNTASRALRMKTTSSTRCARSLCCRGRAASAWALRRRVARSA